MVELGAACDAAGLAEPVPRVLFVMGTVGQLAFGEPVLMSAAPVEIEPKHGILAEHGGSPGQLSAFNGRHAYLSFLEGSDNRCRWLPRARLDGGPGGFRSRNLHSWGRWPPAMAGGEWLERFRDGAP